MNIRVVTRAFFPVVMVFALILPVGAANYVSYSGGTYSENFDSMGAAGTTTPSGWFVGAAPAAQGAISGTTVMVGDGSINQVGDWNLGVSGSTDRALGSQASSLVGGDLAMEVRILNNTGLSITNFLVLYDGEQWRANGASEYPQMLNMYYSTDGATFVAMPFSFSFTSRVDTGSSALNGNLAANRTAGIGGIYTPAAAVPANGTIYLRWHDVNNSGNDHQLAIDNFSFAVIPAVVITSPTNNSNFQPPAVIPVSATVSDFQNAVRQVDFYSGTTLLQHITVAPYAFNWNNVASGSYVLRAIAEDSAGVRATSAPVNVTVSTPTLPGIPLGQTYSFATAPPASDWSTYSVSGGGQNILTEDQLDQAVTNLAASSISQSLVNSSSYANNSLAGWNPLAQTVFTRATGNSATLLMATLINNTGQSIPALNISYTFGNATAIVNEELNGVRAYYSLTGLPGSWTVIPEFSTNGVGTLATRLVLGAWATGTRMYLLWADDNGNGMTDCGWFFSDFLAEVTSGQFVSITDPLNNARVILPTNLVVKASVSGFSNPVTRVTFYSGTTQIGVSSNSPYSCTWAGITPGPYTLRAVALDSTGLSVTSAPVNITAQNNTPPSVAIASPTNGTVLTAPASVNISVAVSDSDGRVTNVVYYSGTQKLGENGFAPFGYTWSDVPLGTYDLRAVAYDNQGAVSTSSVSRVFVVVSTPPVVSSFTPAPGVVSNFNQVTVVFAEPVDGVDASDLLISGVPATAVTGSNEVYTFSFPEPVEGLVAVTWAANTGIFDREIPPKPFSGTGAGDTAHYTLIDTIAPQVSSISPLTGAAVPVLTRIDVVFSEAVAGVSSGSLLINGVAASRVSGSLAGPYKFEFTQPAAGSVQIAWASNHGIHDLSGRANPFGGGSWSYTLDTSGAQTNVVINEIMYHPAPEMPEPINLEWVELYNKGAVAVNLHGWRLSKGIDFAFPNISIPAHAYLVVAANVAAFQAQYPAVNNVVGNWTGKLSNNGDTINVRNALDDVVDSVSYGSQGDWANRLRGRGERQVTSLTRSGSTATAFVFGHDMNSGDHVRIYGADQAGYNVADVAINVTSSSTFTYTVSGSPATPATGVIICRQLTDRGRRGWAWSSLADGLGRSMELVNPNMPNQYGQNWEASTILNGTPGAPNSVALSNVPPLILDVQHYPLVPHSTNAITITARIIDETNRELSVRFYWQDVTTASPTGFLSVQMYDDGVHGDGIANDGIYGGTLPAQANGTVIEFYIGASDMQGNQRTWPAPALDPADNPIQQANALLQVDDSIYNGNQPVYRMIMTEAERAELKSNHDSVPNCDAAMNATFVTIDGSESLLLYNIGVRNRGAGSRSFWPMNYRLSFPNDKRWKGARGLHLNTLNTYSQFAGASLGVRARTDVEAARAVQLLVNGANLAYDNLGSTKGSYIQLEDTSSEYAASHYPSDSAGNAYRGSTGSWNANLDYAGENPSTYEGLIGRGYFKTCNISENDWTDLINLCNVLNNTPDADYAAAVNRIVNVEKWMRNLAFFQLTGSAETALQTGIGDDYYMYRGAKDPRFILLGHDLDTMFTLGGATTRTLFTMCPSVNGGANVHAFDRFMKHPEFVPIYYRELNDLLNTTFRPDQISPALDQALADWAPDVLSGFKNWATNRYIWVRSQIPLRLTVTHSLSTLNGYLHSTSPTISLSGVANAIDTRRVSVNGSDATWTAWTASWTHSGAPLLPGLNYVFVQAFDAAGKEIDRQTLEVWYDRGGETTVGAGMILTDTVWSVAGGPYHITGNLSIGSGATLTIQPGTTVYLDSGVSLLVLSGGRLLAQGTDTQPIRFTRAPGSGATWGQIVVNGGPGSPETRLSYANIEFNGATAISSVGGSLSADHLSFATTTHPYLFLNGSSFMVQDCLFPAPALPLTPVQGTNGIKSGGHGIFLRNYFGATIASSDAVRFSGGNRPGGPILQFINNVFAGSGDDHLQFSGADAWVERNIFLHAHKNASSDTSSAVSGGADGANTSEVTMVGNIFYDCDQAATAKQGSFFTLLNNTIINQTHLGGTDTTGAVVCLADPGTTEAAGMYLEGNIIFSIEKLTRNQTNALVTFSNNLMSLSWSGAGGGNSTNDPLLNYTPSVAETYFTNWAQAQIMKEWFGLQAGSPAAGTGPNFQDKGALIPAGVSISGEPSVATPATSAALRVGGARSGNGISATAWPNGSGYTHYKWRLDGDSWSLETPMATPITLSGLANGPHYIELVGKNDALLYQDDPLLGADAAVTRSSTWIVQTNSVSVRLNEILARNDSAVLVGSKYPDLIELYNPGSTTADLSGMSISDSRSDTRKCVFPPGTYLAASNYLVLYADNDSTPPGLHLGFTLKQESDDVSLYAANGRLVDSVIYGLQIPDLSIGRLADGSWGLTRPTFGSQNQPVQLGSPATLKINEWLARGVSPIPYDFVELFNPDSRPVCLSGLFLTDNAIGAPRLHEVAPLSFIGGAGYAVFLADGNPADGADHLNFRLSSDRGVIALLDGTGSVIDSILYGPQTRDVSQGRSPNGSSSIMFFTMPTPGGPNQPPPGPPGGRLVINEILIKNVPGPNAITNTDGGTPSWIELYNPTTNAINLGGMSLSDTYTMPNKWFFPAGTIIGPNSYRLVLFDPSMPPSSNVVALLNTGFGLPDNGGEIFMYEQPLGGVVLDALAYGVQAVEYSIGRVPSAGTNWVLNLPSPGTANSAASLGLVTQLRVNEWMANPSSGDDWFEIYNANAQPVELSGLYLTDDPSSIDSRKKFKVAPLSFIGSGLYGFQRFWADNAAVAKPDHCNFALKLGGEYLGIYKEGDVQIDLIAFPAQGLGVSEGRLPDGSTNIVRFPDTPSPGDANYLLLTNVVINEILTYAPPGWPVEQAIELQNVSSGSVNIGGWFLSNQKRHLKKFRIPDNTILTSGQFKVFYQSQFYFDPQNASCFLMDSTKGDNLYLSMADTNANLTGYRTTVKFGAPDAAVSFGRYTNSIGEVDFTAMSRHTFGADNAETVVEFRAGTGLANAQPLIGPVVFTEIMYHPIDFPGGVDNFRDEYVELYNVSSNTVQLYDPAYPTNTWRLRDGVDFEFPTGTSLPAGGYLLVVGFDPVTDTNSLAGFRAAYPQLSASAVLYGPFRGRLDNGGERISLYKPRAPIPAGQPGAGSVPYVLVETIKYDDVTPWDPAADGYGYSLQRTDPLLYADDPAHWVAATPTPGPQNSTDSDGDGIPDWWMMLYFGHPTGQSADNSLANQDADQDGMSNLQEYRAATNPRNANSVLRLHIAQAVPGSANLLLSFTAQSNLTYSIYYTDQLNPMAWNPLFNFSASTSNRNITLPVIATGQNRFYRVVTP